MLAIDQRDLLRDRLAQRAEEGVASEDEMVAVNLNVLQSLSGLASGVLEGRAFGTNAALSADCPVMFAVDGLTSPPLGGSEDAAESDTEATLEVAAPSGPSALKQLLPWEPDPGEADVALSEQFMALCRESGLSGIVEGVLRPADIGEWTDADCDETTVTATWDLAEVRPDIFVAEVPSLEHGYLAAVTTTTSHITETLNCPGMVPSSGVAVDEFPAAAGACRHGGASGRLAGRAMWSDAIAPDDPAEFLRSVWEPRLQRVASQ